MTAENDKQDEAPEDAEASGPLGGERLAEARRSMQIPVLEIAKELHLDEYKVRALENNQFDVIGAPVFAKGHLRKYAQLVNVDQADVMADYYQLNRTTDAPPVIPKPPRQRREISPGPWAVAIVVIIVAASVYWWFAVREPAETSTTGEVADLPQTTGDAEIATSSPVDENTIELPEQDTAAEEVGESAAFEAPDVAPAPAPADEPPVVATDELRLSVTYSGDCWTEITDASGRRLFFDLGKAGRTVNLSGEAPFNVLFGNADNVSLAVNGASFEISAANRRGRTARLTIAGP